jgi:PAS domain S-box-containing protein
MSIGNALFFGVDPAATVMRESESGMERLGDSNPQVATDVSAEQPRELLHSVAVGLLMVDANAITLFANDVVGHMVGLPAKALIGMPLAEFLDLEPSTGGRTPSAEGFRDFRLQRADGASGWVSAITRPSTDPTTGLPVTMITLVDVTDRRMREVALHARADAGEVLSQFAELLLRDEEPDFFLSAAARLLTRELGLQMCGIGMAARDRTEVTALASAGEFADQDPDRWLGIHKLPPGSATISAVTNQRPVLVKDYGSPLSHKPGPVIHRTSIRSSATAPIPGTDGWIAAFAEVPGQIDDDAVVLIEDVARLLGTRWPG